jgi:hypothetical protein
MEIDRPDDCVDFSATVGFAFVFGLICVAECF